MADLNLRRLRYFAAVADELNFGRASERLHIAQPVLSRQIVILEQELGVTLFDRSTRGTALTEVGRDLAEDVRALLMSAAALQRHARQSARPVDRLSIGFMPGLIVTPILQQLAHRFPDLDVEIVRTSWDDQVDTILDGRVDLGLVRLPIPEQGLRIEALFSEDRLAVLPASHPLASAPDVSIDDLAALELLQSPDAVPEWRIARQRRGYPPSRATSYPHSVEVKLERVASGFGVAVLPASTARFYTRPDVVVRSVAGLGSSEVALAWIAHRRSAPLRAAIELAHTLRASLGGESVLDESVGPGAS